VGLLQIAVMLTLFAGAGALAAGRAGHRPRRGAHRHRLHADPPAGPVRVVLFFSIDPLWDALIGQLRVCGLHDLVQLDTRCGPA
jgi:hypothetical protein